MWFNALEVWFQSDDIRGDGVFKMWGLVRRLRSWCLQKGLNSSPGILEAIFERLAAPKTLASCFIMPRLLLSDSLPFTCALLSLLHSSQFLAPLP